MVLYELILISLGVSADAFAIALCKGLNMEKFNRKNAIIIASFFGGFQAIMPLIGWSVGKQFEQYIMEFDHWIAFIILAAIGVLMLMEAFEKEEEVCSIEEELSLRRLFVLSIATSVDALAVGVTFAFLDIAIIPAISLIGVITFVASLIGVRLGNKLCLKFKKRAQIAGGSILILMGIKILLEHLYIL